MQTHTDISNFALPFIIGSIIGMFFIAGFLFLIIYGIIKKKKSYWITGVVASAFYLLIYLLFYTRSYNRSIDAETEARKQIFEDKNK